jgi:hypothetical protein
MSDKQKFNICLKKSELTSTGATGVYSFTLNIPELNNYRKFELLIKDYIVITATTVNHNMYQLNSNTLRYKNNYSSKNSSNNNSNVVNDGTILASITSEIRAYQGVSEPEEIYNPNGRHQIWNSDHATNAPVDLHDWFVNLLIIASN